MKIPKDVETLLTALNINCYEAYVVGGCVRDSLMDKEPHDWDITTSATPDQVKEVFKFDNYRIIDTGLKHGTVTVIYNGQQYEITTFRVDGQYSDNRRPDSVSFTSSLREDLSRRDFTINAIAYNPVTGLIDPFGGTQDIQNRIIRCVGVPDERFQEDALRILRALRFASVLGFDIDLATHISIFTNKDLIKNISAERINSEFCKILCSNTLTAWSVWDEYKEVIAVFIPEIVPMFGCKQKNPYHKYDVWNHTLAAVRGIEADLKLRLVMFFHDIAKPICKFTGEDGIDHFYGHPTVGSVTTDAILRRLKFDNETREFVVKMVLNHDMEFKASLRNVKKYLNQFDFDGFDALMKVRIADKKAQSEYAQAGYFEKLGKIKDLIKEIKDISACFQMKDLAINGNDIIALGLPPGKLIGLILGYLLQQVMEDNIQNKKEILIAKATEYINEMKGLQK